MPVLSNARWERFAQELAKGKTADAAYVEAGFKKNRHNASTLKQRETISNRVAELLAGREEMDRKSIEMAAEALGIDKQWVMAELVDNVALAKQKHDIAPANKALELIGKELGMFIDRKEVGGPGEFARMSDDELVNYIRREFEKIGYCDLGISVSAKPNVSH